MHQIGRRTIAGNVDGFESLPISARCEEECGGEESCSSGCSSAGEFEDRERNDSVSAVRAEELPKREESKLKEIANVKEEVESVPIVNVERVVNQVSALGEPLC